MAKKEIELVGGELPQELVDKLRKDFEAYLKEKTPNVKYENLIARRPNNPVMYKSLYSEYAFQAYITAYKKYGNKHYE